MQVVGGGQAFVAVGALHEFVAESSAPVGCMWRGLADRLQAKAAGILAADFYRESVVESEWRADFQIELFLILCFDFVVDFFAIGTRFFFQDCGQGSAGVFGVDVDPASENGLLADKSSGEIKAALDGKMSFDFDLLGD